MRVKATTLESFRLLRTADWMTEERFLAQVRGELPPTEEMLWGRAVHACLEDPDAHRALDGSFVAEGRVLSGDVVERCLEAVPRAGVHEVRGEKVYDIDGVTVTVSCIADQLVGNALYEHKTKWGSWSPDDYAKSLQWRIYAEVFFAASVRYTIFPLALRGDEVVLTGDPVALTPFYPYPEMGGVIRCWLGELVSFVRERDLFALFPDRKRWEAA